MMGGASFGAACREYILLEDLCQFLPEDRAKAAFPVLDCDGDGRVSMADMRDAVVAIYKERKNLALTLKARAAACRLVHMRTAGAHVPCRQHRTIACMCFLLLTEA
jgi:hypothetical protein